MNSTIKLSGLFIVACLFLTSGTSSAQNYKAIKTDATSYFYDSVAMDIIPIRIDSVSSTGNENQYFGMRQIRQTDYGCFTPEGASWLGDVVTENPTGVFQFILFPFSPADSADVFTIRSKALTGESWHFYNFHTSNNYIEAIVTQIHFTSFIGLTDSVKTISLQRKDATGQNVSDPINGQKVLLSQNYGLIRLPKFDEFNTNLKFLDLCGKTNPVIGITNLTFDKIFDFQPGDELHVIYDDNPYTNFYPTESGSIKQIIIEKINLSSSDTICYRIAECKTITKALGINQETTINTSDTIVEKYVNTYFLDCAYEPKEPFFNLYWTGAMSDAEMGLSATDLMSFTGIPWKFTFAHGFLVQGLNPDWQCWQPAIIDDYLPQSFYYKGLGGPYYSRMNIGVTQSYRKLVYYRKGSETWGSPLDCDSLLHVGLPEYSQIHTITIYPNPTSGTITVSVPDDVQFPCHLELFDAAGRKTIEFSMTQELQSFDLSGLASGWYSYKLSTTCGKLSRGKIILQ